ncbi:Chemotaxis protein CheX [Gammaproteobacteria bacterium]
MSNDKQLTSKVLVLDNSTEHIDEIKQFCDQNGLVGLKVSFANVVSILSSNVDLGAILLAERYCGCMEDTMELASQISATRPELPIMLRRESPDCDHLPDNFRKLFCVIYSIEDLSPLKKAIDEYIFSLVYPNVLVRGISEITTDVLSNQFESHEVISETPYIVRDRSIFGEVFSLIPLESSWCRGYMMLQTEEAIILGLIGKYELSVPGSAASFRSVNNMLAEITNLIWGAFKNRFITYDDPGSRSISQVPIVINHLHRYISFGSENPHLRFKYSLVDKHGSSVLSFYQWFVFNLHWSPEDFKEVQSSVDELVESGELELF